MRLIGPRFLYGLFFAYMAAFFGVLIAGWVNPRYDHSLAANVVRQMFFAFAGSVSISIAFAALRSGSITVGKHRKQTFTRAERPVDFWGFTLWFLIFGLFFLGIGVVSLVSLAVRGPS